MLVREQSWQRDEEQSTGNRIKDPDEIYDYYKSLNRYMERLKCETFNCKIVYAYQDEITYSRKTKRLKSEVLHLICLIEGTDMYHDISIFGRTKVFNDRNTEWGEWGKNGNALNDVMEIIAHQKQNYLEHYTFSNDYGDKEVYPHICGTRVKVLGTVKEMRTSAKGKLYEVNDYAIFDPNGYSGWEIKMGIKDHFDYQKKFNDFTAMYQNFCEDNGIAPQQQQVQPQQQEQAVSNPMIDSMQAFQSSSNSNSVDDDLPF